MVLRLRDIAADTTPLSVTASAQSALQRFLSEPGLDALPILLDETDWRLLTRTRLLEAFAQPGGHHDIGRQAASAFAYHRPAIVDAAAPAATIAARAVKSASPSLRNGLILRDGDAYAGYVAPAALLCAISEENAARARAMQRVRRKLADTEREQAEFLALVGHEIRTPLTGVLGLADLLLEAKIGEGPRTYARSISQSGDHLKRVLDDLLDASRLRTGKVSVTPRPFDLKSFASEIEAFWRGGLTGRAIALTAFVEKGSVKRIEADEARLRQIIFNLVSNALKFTEQGEISVKLAVRPDEDDALGLTLSVTDTGAGVAPEDKARLFDAFERAEGMENQDGVGLGLFVARSLAEQMDGAITLDDNPGGGTVFTVSMPVEKAGPRLAVANPEPPRQRTFELGRLLLVEDHDTTRFVMETSLTAAGWTVDAVQSGLKAARRASETPYQAILSDLRLPDIDGEQLVRQIRAGGGPNAAAPILAATADVSEARLDAALEAGFDAIVEKPIRPRALVTTIADAILSAQPRAAMRRTALL